MRPALILAAILATGLAAPAWANKSAEAQSARAATPIGRAFR